MQGMYEFICGLLLWSCQTVTANEFESYSISKQALPEHDYLSYSMVCASCILPSVPLSVFNLEYLGTGEQNCKNCLPQMD